MTGWLVAVYLYVCGALAVDMLVDGGMARRGGQFVFWPIIIPCALIIALFRTSRGDS